MWRCSRTTTATARGHDTRHPESAHENTSAVDLAAEWFGIDYYGEFWIKVPGDYDLRMSSDDGAILYIDENSVIHLNGVHTILSARRANCRALPLRIADDLLLDT